MITNIGNRIKLGGLAAVLVIGAAAGTVHAQQIRSASNSDVAAPAGAQAAAPLLLRKETLDVDGDGVADTVSYFDSDNDGVVDGEAIDVGSTGTVTVLAIRTDSDNDGRQDDWVIVNAQTEEVRAALVDTNDDGDADTVMYGDGKSQALPVVAMGDAGGIQAAFDF